MKILTKTFAINDEKKAKDFLLKMTKKGYSGRVETAYYRNYKDNMVYYWKLDDFQIGDYVAINKEMTKVWTDNLWKTNKYIGKAGKIIKKTKYIKDNGGNIIYTLVLQYPNGETVSAMSNYVEKINSIKNEEVIKLRKTIKEEIQKIFKDKNRFYNKQQINEHKI